MLWHHRLPRHAIVGHPSCQAHVVMPIRDDYLRPLAFDPLKRNDIMSPEGASRRVRRGLPFGASGDTDL
jgi:hypothetical protein